MSLNSLQDNMSRRAASMAAMAKRATNPQQIEAIQKSLVAGVQSGAIQPYVGIPLIQELTKKLTEAKAQMAQTVAGAGMQQPPQGQQAPQPPIAQQVMAQAAQADQSQGVEALQSNLPQSYAGGGIIAFEEGGPVERYQNTGFTGMGNVGTPYSATNPNAAMGEFLRKLGMSPAEFANARPEAQKNILDMFKSVSEAPKPMATPTVTPTAPTAPATSGPYRAGQAVGQAVRGGTSGAGNLLSRGLIGTIGGPATGGIFAALTPSSLGDDQAVLAALRGEGYRDQPYDVLNARKILEAAGMDPNKAPIKPVTPVATAPSAAPGGPGTQTQPPAPAADKVPQVGMPNLKLPSLTLPTGGSLTDYNQLIGDMPAKTKAASEAKVTEVQKKYDDMDKPGFDIREEKFGKREAGLGKDIAINRALGIISTGLGVAGSKERSIAGALGNEGRQGIRDLIQGEAANRAAKDRLDDARDNFEQQKVAAKKGNYQAAETAGNRAADDLRASTQLTMTGAHYGNTEANQRLQLDQQGVISKAQLEQQGILGLGQIQATNAATNAQLKLGYAKLGVIKGQIAAGNDRAKAALANAEQKAYTAFRQDPETQKLYKNLEVKFGSNYMQNPQAQAQIQQATKMYMANAVPSLLGAEGGGGIPSFNDLQKAME